MAVSFDLFGTLVAVDMPADPATAVAIELRDRGVSVPRDFGSAYREMHIDAPDGAEIPLPAHVAAALSSRGIDAPDDVVREAVVAAFDSAVERREGTFDAIEMAAELGPLGICSNCSVPDLVGRTLVRAGLQGRFDAVVTSVGCGWRKPNRRIFETLADTLDADVASITHVGDTPETDGGIESVGGRYLDIDDTPLSALSERLESNA